MREHAKALSVLTRGCPYSKWNEPSIGNLPTAASRGRSAKVADLAFSFSRPLPAVPAWPQHALEIMKLNLFWVGTIVADPREPD